MTHNNKLAEMKWAHEQVLRQTPEQLGLRYADPRQTAIVIMPGGGSREKSDSRFRLPYSEAVARHVRGGAKIIVCGTRNDPGYSRKQIETLVFRNLGALRQNVLFQGYAANTPAQTVWAAQLIWRLGVRCAVYTAEEYHLPRVMLTYANSHVRHCRNRQLVAAVLPTKNAATAVGSRTSQTLDQELVRMATYLAKGHLRSFQTAAQLFAWKT